MGEYYDFGINLKGLLELWYGNPESDDESEVEESFDGDSTDSKRYQSTSPHSPALQSRPTYTSPVEVRKAICVTGLDREQVQYVKNTLGTLLQEPFPLESFHIKRPSDIQNGALMVPKVVIVANHMPGKLLIDDEGDNGQIDFLYDELIETGADILVIYMGLPKTVYPSMRHMIYHPRMIDIVFPDQPLLRELAEENKLITTVGNTDFTSMQKNLMKEWLSKPVSSDHPVFKYATKMNPLCEDETNFWSETEIYNRNWYPREASSTTEPAYKSATEEHPLADKKKKKKKSKFFKIRKKKDYKRMEEAHYDEFDEDLEMEMYRHSGFTVDSFQIST